MTQEELAQKAGVPQPNLSQIEKGKRDLTVSTLKRISAALEIKAGELIDGPESIALSSPFKFTRPRIERIARAVVHNGKKISPSEREFVRLLCCILPAKTSQKKSLRKTQQAWAELSQGCSKQEIQSLLGRIRDEEQRAA